MLDPELFRTLAQAGHKAASPDNLQAWRFEAVDGALHVHLPREGRLPTDVDDMFSLIGIGCAVENIVVAASAQGHTASVTVDRQPSAHGERIAIVTFAEGGEKDPLADVIDRRCTNRKPYATERMADDVAGRLESAAAAVGARVDLLHEDGERDRVGSLIADNDWIRMSHQPLHAELFDIFRLSAAEADRGDGLDLASLELPGAAGLFLRLVGKWPVARVLNAIGLAKGFAKGSGDAARASAAVGLITADTPDTAGYVAAGRALQRIWLQAAADGMAMQPIGGLAQYLTKVEREPEGFLPEQAAHLRTLKDPFYALFPAAKDRTLGILFRVGVESGPPLGRSRRRPLDTVLVS